MLKRYLLLTFMICSTLALAQINPGIENDTLPVKKASDEPIKEHQGASGFKIIQGKDGSLTISFFIMTRYLNQKGIDDSYTNYKGEVIPIDRRQDIQFQKSNLYFKGWVGVPEFRYYFFIWTSNATMGQGAQIILAGSAQYMFNKNFDVGVGVSALPNVRSLLLQWPNWLRSDARPIAEEFFRGSLTMGFWIQGQITDGLYYKSMLANNLSALGVDAGQMDDKIDTWSTGLWWVTNDFGPVASYGDYEYHDSPATVLGGGYTQSTENAQSQPGTDVPENSQIRLSDGTAIFSANALAPNTQILTADYQMMSLYGGVKYKGLSLDLEYFHRRVSGFKAVGDLPVSRLLDTGFSVQASGMLIKKQLQLYSTYSYINGEYGIPTELVLGLNFFPLKQRYLRINPEVMFVDHSPVGYLSYPMPVGANGIVGMINLEVNF